MSNIDQIREREARGERQICARALLQDPLLQARGPHSAVYRLIRRHADWLRTWFVAETESHCPITVSHLNHIKSYQPGNQAHKLLSTVAGIALYF